jgi:hypothetical protein
MEVLNVKRQDPQTGTRTADSATRSTSAESVDEELQDLGLLLWPWMTSGVGFNFDLDEVEVVIFVDTTGNRSC